MSDLHLKALNSAKTFQAKYIYGNTKIKNNNGVGGAVTMENFQDNALQNKSTMDRMKRKIIVSRNEKVRQSIALNTL